MQRIRLALALAGLLAASGCGTRKSGPYTSIGELRRLPVGATAQVRLSAIVTFHSDALPRTFVQDASGGAEARFAVAPPEVRQGDRLEITGSAVRNGPGITITASRAVKAGDAPIPAAIPITPEDFGQPVAEGLLGTARGVLEAASIDRFGMLAIELRAGGIPVDVRIRDYVGFDFTHRIGDTVAVSGAVRTVVDTKKEPVRRQLWAQDQSAIRVLSEAAALPLRTVAGCRRECAPNQRARMSGVLGERVGAGEFRLAGKEGEIRVRLAPDSAVVTGRLIEVAGFVERRGPDIVLRNAAVREASRDGVPAVLRRIADVRRMPATVAAGGAPVLLRATVTYHDPDRYVLFAQDETGGVYISCHGGPPPHVSAGDVVEISGVTAAGDFAPIVLGRGFRRLGRARLPAAAALPFEHIAGGLADSRLISVSGIVRQVTADGAHFDFKLRTAGTDIPVHVLGISRERAEAMLDARVRATGVSGAVFNPRRQLLGTQLFTAAESQVAIEEPPSAAAAPTRIIRFQQYAPGATPGHRVKARGVVTALDPASQAIYVQDATGGTEVRMRTDARLAVGDLVEATGYVEPKELGTVLSDASVSPRGHSSGPAPLEIGAADELDALPADVLVVAEAVVAGARVSGVNYIVSLHAGPAVFQASLPFGRANAPALESGARVRLTGVSRILPAAGKSGFDLLLRSASDVQVLQDAPFLTNDRAERGLVVFVAVGLGAILWAWQLRRKVRQQTRIIREQLDQAESLKHAAEAGSRAKSEFLANMSHEIRTPLNGIVGFAGLALEHAGDDDEMRESLEIVCDSAQVLIQIVNDVLDLSKIEAGQLRFEAAPFSLHDAIRKASRLFAATAADKGLDLRVEIAAEVPDAVEGDALRLRQMLANLVANAVKFTAEGYVAVRAAASQVTEESATVAISVADTGIGIAKEHQATIFTAFTQADSSITRRFGGTGLGLTICARLAQMGGGALSLESAVGAGSTFTLTLPFRRSRKLDAPVEVSRPADALHGLAVLVAEDNVVNQRLMDRVLTRAGCRVTVAADGMAAVEAFVRGNFDLVLMDLQMPRMDGFIAAKAIRRVEGPGRRTPIIALTADVMAEAQQRARNCGMDGYVTKPVRVDDLRREVERCYALAEAAAVQVAGD